MSNAAAVIIIGYSGHGYVVTDCLRAAGHRVVGYCDRKEKTNDPFGLRYLGPETEPAALDLLHQHPYFIAIGHNDIRRRVAERLAENGVDLTFDVVHPSAVVSPGAQLGGGVLVAPGAAINALAQVGRGVVVNTGCVVEHECVVGSFAHLAPGSVLAGNVRIGAGTFVGANATVIQGVQVGESATIGAGAVVLRDVPDGATVVGNPARVL